MKYDYKMVEAASNIALQERLNIFGADGWRVHTVFSRDGVVVALMEKGRTGE